MINFDEIVNEASGDNRKVAFIDQMKISRILSKDSKLKKHLNSLNASVKDLYFDNDDFVLFDQTILQNSFDDNVTLKDLKDAVYKFKEKVRDDEDNPNTPKIPAHKKAQTTKSGVNYDVTYDSRHEKRAIIPLTTDQKDIFDKLVKAFKNKNGRGSVKIRPMKRKNGFKIYVDAKTTEFLKQFIDYINK